MQPSPSFGLVPALRHALHARHVFCPLPSKAHSSQADQIHGFILSSFATNRFYQTCVPLLRPLAAHSPTSPSCSVLHVSRPTQQRHFCPLKFAAELCSRAVHRQRIRRMLSNPGTLPGRQKNLLVPSGSPRLHSRSLRAPGACTQAQSSVVGLECWHIAPARAPADSTQGSRQMSLCRQAHTDLARLHPPLTCCCSSTFTLMSLAVRPRKTALGGRRYPGVQGMTSPVTGSQARPDGAGEVDVPGAASPPLQDED